MKKNPGAKKNYKYDCNYYDDLQSLKFKMQFKVITTILLFFVAQTMATPRLQTRDEATPKTCTLAFTGMILCQGPKLIMITCGYLRR